MFVPVNWLKEYVEIEDIDIKKLSEDMIMSGSNIENVNEVGQGITGVVIGKILRIEEHPDADKLSVTCVDVGEEVLTIVTGASNVCEGDFIPVVKVGGVLPGNVKIKKGKLRGVESYGMLCSARELGYEDKVIPVSHRDGIFILEGEYEVGMDIFEALDMKDHVIEFEITPNRPDCLSIIGLAREAAAVYEKKVKYPEIKVQKEEGHIEDYVSIEIKRPDLCNRYVGRVIKDIKIKKSPWWLEQRLMNAGVRPINNIVDVTNYVMLEYGQPMHAFDMRYVEGQKIIVDTAKDGEIFTTLDGAERKLNEPMLLIKDGEKAVGLAGVMGGLNSEVKDDTQVILLESANFDADNTRATSKKLGLRTEASSRYEKGLDPNLCLDAINRACYLIELLGAGTVVGGIIDQYENADQFQAEEVVVRGSRINQLLGTEIANSEIANIFKRLEIHVKEEGDILHCTPPTIRLDLKNEVDFLEEAARIYGYDKLPITLPKGNVQGGKRPKRTLEDLAKETLISLGLNEIQTYSFVSPKGVDMIRVPEDSIKRNFVRILNPLGEENSVMRTTLIPNMLEVLLRNVNRNNDSAMAFECGKVFLNMKEGKDALPEEPTHIAIGMYGDKIDFYALKGVVEELLEKMGMKKLEFIPESTNSTFHGGRCAKVYYQDTYIGILGELHPDVIDNYDLGQRVYMAELDFEKIYSCADTVKYYKPLPKYPSIGRDIALVVKEEVYVKQIEDIITKNGGSILEKIELFDIYRGKQVKEGHKSAAFALTYRDANKTLTDEEVAKVHHKVVKALEDELEATLRD
jgi:phenylalanyl-tRNA synthetase beta chain